MSVIENLNRIKAGIPTNVKLVAVSKFHPTEAIKEAYDAGHRMFAESRMQEFDKKHTDLPNDIEWHFIGHLQRNKVKEVLPYVSMIHSVDSVRLFNEIQDKAKDIDKDVACLLQIHIADEDTKYGFSFDECEAFLKEGKWKDRQAYIAGVMGMATFTKDEALVRSEFRALKSFFNELKMTYFSEDSRFCEISMGMSNDYKIAIEEGSTMVRIGSSIFGEREY